MRMVLAERAAALKEIADCVGEHNLKDIIQYFVEHRHDVVVRRTQFELRKAEERAHILEGLIIACDNIDEVVQIIRSSRTTDESIKRLMERFELSEIQAQAILDLQNLLQQQQEQIENLKNSMKSIGYSIVCDRGDINK